MFGNLRLSFRASVRIGVNASYSLHLKSLVFMTYQGHHQSVSEPETEIQLYRSVVFIWYLTWLCIKVIIVIIRQKQLQRLIYASLSSLSKNIK